jgi:hypothetical protein
METVVVQWDLIEEIRFTKAQSNRKVTFLAALSVLCASAVKCISLSTVLVAFR